MAATGTSGIARKYFDRAMSMVDTDPAAARRFFHDATDADSSMADAWLGRIAAGDDALTTVEMLYRHGSRLHR